MNRISEQAAEPPVAVLAPVVSEILETMYFCTPGYLGRSALDGPVVGAKVAFTGSVSGELRVVASVSLVNQLAADFLGMNPSDIPTTQLHATIREFANVACCATIAAWKPGQDFQFSIPRKLDPVEMNETTAHGFSFDAGIAEMALDVKLADQSILANPVDGSLTV